MIKPRTPLRAELAMKKLDAGTLADSRQQSPETPASQSLSHRFIVLSRQCGVGSHPIAVKIAENLQWQVFDHELLDQVAQQFDIPTARIDILDERSAPWPTKIFYAGILEHTVTPQACVHRVAEVVREAASRGSCVIVGRGAQFLLPRENGLFVRLIASRDFRANNIAKFDGITIEEAKKKIQSVDEHRADFIKRYYHHDITDPTSYDLVLDVETLGAAGVVDCILSANHAVAA